MKDRQSKYHFVIISSSKKSEKFSEKILLRFPKKSATITRLWKKVHTIHVPTDVPVSITVTSANPVRSAGDRIVRNVIHLAILTVLILRNRFA